MKHGQFKSTHTTIALIDEKTYSLSTFMKYAHQGSPHILEAMFAPDEFVVYEAPLMQAIRANFYADAAKASYAYEKCINGYAAINTPKALAHIERLRSNFNDLYKYGRFNPRVM